MRSKSATLGLLWSFIDNFSQQIINFIVGIILARLLSPEEFGVLGIITVFIAICTVFVDAGLSDALINKQDIQPDDYNTAFIANVFIGLTCFGLLYFVAPYIAKFYDMEELTFYLKLSALSIILFSLSSVQRAILTKDLNFKVITKISFFSVLVSGCIAIYMAYDGFGILSLIFRIIIGQFFTVILFFVFSSWRPKLEFNKTSFKQMFAYGMNLFFSKFMNVVYSNFYYFIIGKCFSPSVLGYYTRADSFKAISSTNISNTVTRVSFASLSAMNDKHEQIRHFEIYLFGTTFITAFSMSFLFGCADSIILLLLGDKWFPSIEYLKILSLSGLFLPIYFLNLSFLAVIRKTRRYFITELISKLAIIPAVILGLFFGIQGLLWSMFFHIFISCLYVGYQIGQVSEYGLITQMKKLYKILMLFGLSVLFSLLLRNFLPNLDIHVNTIVYILSIILIYSLGYFCSKAEYKLIIDTIKQLFK